MHRYAGQLRRSVPLGAAVVINGVYFRVDAVMVATLAGVAAAGRYGIAYRVLDSVLLVPAVVGAAALPALVRARDDTTTLHRRTGRLLQGVVLVMTPVVLVGWLAAPWVVRVLGGPAFASSASVLRVLLVAAWFSSVDVVLGLLIVAAGLQGRLLWLNLGALVVNVAGNLVLIPHLAGLGAAAMTAGCEAAVAVVAGVALHRIRGYQPRIPAAGRLVAVTSLAVCTAALLVPAAGWAVAASGACLVYGVGVLVTRVVSLRDLRPVLAAPAGMR